MKYFLAAALLVLNVAYAADEFRFAPEPGWLTHTEVPEASETPLHEVRDGAHYLHYARQVKVPEKGDPAYHYRYTVLITNQTGLDDQSQINVSFDPVYERVEFHRLNIIRDGQTLDRLKSARLRLLDQEEDLDQQLYNGTRTANLLLEDLRVGDVIDYSYTLYGDNPVFDGAFNAEFKLQWSVPVTSLYFRLLWEKENTLQHRISSSDWQLESRKLDKGVEYQLHRQDVRPLLLEDDVPDWFNPYASLQLSEQPDWRSVADWGQGLFDSATTSNADIRRIADDIRSQESDRDGRVAATLQFVQDNIRYVGIELGINSHQASPAPQVLARRYGDCKDKTSLMISILGELGIEAFPALVNTYREDKIAGKLPSMHAFNHVLVALPNGEKTLWLDPTRSHQVGSLDQIYQPDYGVALVLKPGAEALTDMDSGRRKAGYHNHEHYIIDPENHGVVDLTVMTEYYGANAEWQIGRFQRDSIGEIEQSYVEFYQSYFPKLKSLRVPEFEIDPHTHVFRVKEFYRIDGFWEDNTEEARDNGWVYSSTINSYLNDPDQVTRNQPYDIGRPIDIRQSIKIDFGEDGWEFEDFEFEEDNPFFRYEMSEKFDAPDAVMQLEYRYLRKTDRIAPEDFPTYLAALERADEQTDFGFYRRHEASDDIVEAVSDFDYETLLIYLFMAVYVLSLLGAILLWRLDRRSNPDPETMKYYPLDAAKFAFLWITTFGVFPIYWFYRLWRYEKSLVPGRGMWPLARGIFFYIWLYPSFQALTRYLGENRSPDAALGRWVFVLLSFLLIFMLFVPVFVDLLWIPALILSPLIVLPLLSMVNHANREDPAAQQHNSRWGVCHLLLLVISLPILFYGAGTETGFFPKDSVVRGDQLASRDVKYLQRAGVVEPGDRIAFFYSDAMWSMRNDGNGISQRHVFSYWKDEDDHLQIEQVDFDKIDDIAVHWSTSAFENTIVEVYRRDRSKVVLYLSHQGWKDKTFVKELKARVKKANRTSDG